ncbi:hypothetical protein Ddc_16777 [Ditylenchus destructor]|nr:hypothetical protein Ddc_16777 [Ditylenchus destructor]
MGGVVIHYQTRDAVKGFGQAPAETKRLFENYEIGLSCVEEVQKLVEGFYKMTNGKTIDEMVVEDFMGDMIAIDKLNLASEECIFLDDVAVNCMAAEEVGMTAIQVAPGDTSSALDELETLLSIKLK